MTDEKPIKIYIEDPTGERFETEIPPDTLLNTIATDFFETRGFATRLSRSSQRAVVELVDPQNPDRTKRLEGRHTISESGVGEGAILRIFPETMAGCFLGKVEITLASGQKKAIQDVEVNDALLSGTPGANKLTTAEVKRVFKSISHGYLILNGTLHVTESHPIWSNGRWVTASELTVGDLLQDSSGNSIELKSIERRDKWVEVYNLCVSSIEHTFFAENLLVHNAEHFLKSTYRAGQQQNVDLPVNVIAKLADVARLISSKKTIGPEAFDQILSLSREITNADFGTIHLFDKETGALRMAAYLGKSHHPPEQSPYSIQHSIPGWAFSTANPVIVHDVSRSPRYISLFPNTESELSVPLFYKDEVVGVLSLESVRLHHFTEEQVRIVELLASILTSTFQREEMERLRSEVNLLKVNPSTEMAFVLTPFREPFNKYYSTIIKPAVQGAGLVSLRADEIYAPTEIIKDIWAAINNAKVIIAELTTRNPNVMYELGLSHALNKPVVMISQSTDDIPFDLRSLRCILYDTTEPDWADSLRLKLTEFIKAVLSGKKYKGLFDDVGKT